MTVGQRSRPPGRPSGEQARTPRAPTAAEELASPRDSLALLGQGEPGCEVRHESRSACECEQRKDEPYQCRIDAGAAGKSRTDSGDETLVSPPGELREGRGQSCRDRRQAGSSSIWPKPTSARRTRVGELTVAAVPTQTIFRWTFQPSFDVPELVRRP